MKIQFNAKYIINFDIICKTGLHIGGGDTGGEIGDIDNPVIKDPLLGYPIIAGSSLKGRIRERLEWLHIDKLDNQNAISRQLIPNEKGEIKFEKVKPCNCGKCQICRYFGHSAKLENKDDDKLVVIAPTRFLFRDAFPKRENGFDQIKIWDEQLGGNIYTELKFENTISRLTAEANPRQMERVPAGSIFRGEIVIDLYEIKDGGQIENDNIQSALALLFQGLCAVEQSFLGGAGSRGSGRVEFNNFRIKKYSANYYLDPDVKHIDFPQIKPELNAQKIFETKTYSAIS